MITLFDPADTVETAPLSGSPLDRRADLRTPEKLTELAAASNARLLTLWRGRAPMIGRASALTGGWGSDSEIVSGSVALAWRAWPQDLEPNDAIFLGLTPDGAPRFTIDISADHPDPDAPPTDEIWAGLREALQGLDPGEAAIFSGALAALTWWRTHMACARCGGQNRLAEGGWKSTCETCNADHFPRTDPVAIMLPVRGDRCLLGRQAAWPEGRYSMLAGFMEPGETIEEAVRRETMEEVGLRLGAVRYLVSQPWPFPGSLMIGCLAEALHDDLTINHDEIEDAKWFSRAEVVAALDGAHPWLQPPLKGAIARTVVEAWARRSPKHIRSFAHEYA